MDAITTNTDWIDTFLPYLLFDLAAICLFVFVYYVFKLSLRIIFKDSKSTVH